MPNSHADNDLTDLKVTFGPNSTPRMNSMRTAPHATDILVFYNRDTVGASALSCMVTSEYDNFAWFAKNDYVLLGWIPVPALPLPLPPVPF